MTDSAIRLAIHGARGRMGARLCALAQEDDRFALVASIDSSDDHRALGALSRDPATRFRLIIDFSSDAGAHAATALALEHGAALLVGTTALSAKTREGILAAASRIPVMIAPNTSLGVAAVRRLATLATTILGGYDIDIVETHHTRKKDAPSGTALAIAASVEAGGRALAPERIHAIRAGDVIGEHTLQFASEGEVIQITHRATTRDLFVRGALRAGAWLARQSVGAYSIDDSLGV